MNNRRKELMLASAREYCKCVVEGKTLRYNQWLVNGNFSNGTDRWYGRFGTVSASNNVLTYTATEIGANDYTNVAYQVVHSSGKDLIVGHKYLLIGYIKPNVSAKIQIYCTQCYDISTNRNTTIPANTWSFAYLFVTASTNDYCNFQIGIDMRAMQVGDSYQIKDCYLIDLTALGLDNITTTDQFFATDLGKYIAKGNYLPYETEGKFINATSPLYFKGRNMLSLARTQGTLSGFANTTPRDLKENEYYVGLSINNYYQPVNAYYVSKGANEITIEARYGYGVAFPIKVKPNTNYKVNYISSETDTYKIGWFDELGNILSFNSNSSGDFTSPNSAYWGVLVLAPADETRTTYTNIMFCEASDYQSKYEPYCSTQVFENGLTLQKGDKYKSYSIDSVEYNQIVQNGNFEDSQNWNTSNGSLSVSNNVGTLLATNQNGQVFAEITRLNLDHKYLFSANIKLASANNGVVVLLGYEAPIDISVPANTNFQTISRVFTLSSSNTRFNLYFRDTRASGFDKIEISNVMVIDLTALGLTNVNSIEDFNKTKLGMFLSKGYYLPYTTTTKTIKDQLVRTMKEIDLSTLTWLNNDDSLYALLPSGFKTFEYSDTQTIIAEKYPTGTNNGQIYITNVYGVGYCIRIEGGYTLGITPSGKALCEILTPQIIDNFEQSFDVDFGDTNMWEDNEDYTNVKMYLKSFFEYAPTSIENDDEYHYPDRGDLAGLVASEYGYCFINGRLFMKMSSVEWESGNGLTYTFTATKVPTRMVSRRTINVESENEIDLDFTKE